jgi:hypothetical protein
VDVGVFFVNTRDGRVATRDQLADAGLTDETSGRPGPPWHQIQGPSDASTMWYAVLRKPVRGIYIGTLCIRHTGRQPYLEGQGWEEVPIEQIGVDGAQAM